MLDIPPDKDNMSKLVIKKRDDPVGSVPSGLMFNKLKVLTFGIDKRKRNDIFLFWAVRQI